jgi:hypothetical protein
MKSRALFVLMLGGLGGLLSGCAHGVGSCGGGCKTAPPVAKSGAATSIDVSCRNGTSVLAKSTDENLTVAVGQVVQWNALGPNNPTASAQFGTASPCSEAGASLSKCTVDQSAAGKPAFTYTVKHSSCANPSAPYTLTVK